MLIAIFARDKPDALQVRLDNRSAHLDYIKQSGVVVQAGPLMIDDKMAGSLLILDVDSLKAGQDWAAGDPYAKAGLFSGVDVVVWNRVIG